MSGSLDLKNSFAAISSTASDARIGTPLSNEKTELFEVTDDPTSSGSLREFPYVRSAMSDWTSVSSFHVKTRQMADQEAREETWTVRQTHTRILRIVRHATRSRQNLAEQLHLVSELRGCFTVEGDLSRLALVISSSVHRALLDAYALIPEFFGRAQRLSLRAVENPETGEVQLQLRIQAQPLGLEQAINALNLFDQKWWMSLPAEVRRVLSADLDWQ